MSPCSRLSLVGIRMMCNSIPVVLIKCAFTLNKYDISSEFKREHKKIEWRKISGFRGKLIHG